MEGGRGREGGCKREENEMEENELRLLGYLLACLVTGLLWSLWFRAPVSLVDGADGMGWDGVGMKWCWAELSGVEWNGVQCSFVTV